MRRWKLLDQFREREGAETAADMRARNATRARMHARDGGPPFTRACLEFQAAEREAGRNCWATPASTPAPGPGVAVLVDRSDIREELTRLRVHATQLDDLAGQGREIGKKLDFMLQEMHRETNTILSKSTGGGELGLKIAELALTVKAESPRRSANRDCRI